MWQPRLEEANLFCFGGGNEQYLARIMRESGLSELLPEFLKTRVYIGISAGSMVAGQFLSKELLKVVYPEDNFEGKLEPALGFVDCNFIPHLNSPHFPQARKEVLQSLKNLTSPLYALDDQSALKIIDKKIEVVTEGEYLKT
ncbi:MAG: peptidase E [Candidatus Portnoybacteria bacterium]|nr:peptidase E [Candidatus Portnoybacteria bacterium]